MHQTQPGFMHRSHYMHIGVRDDLPLRKVHLETTLEPIIRATPKGFDPFFETQYDINKKLELD